MKRNSTHLILGILATGGMLMSATGLNAGFGRTIYKEVTVNASLDQAWEAWTTEEGVKTFFAPKANVDAVIGGPYEMFFLLENPYGQRGGEDLKVHSVVPRKRFVFQWKSPPEQIVTRRLRTLVYLEFEELGPDRTKVHFANTGYGDGPEWDQAYEYFTSAWNVILGRFKIRFESGPLDWSNPPGPTESFAVEE